MANVANDSHSEEKKKEEEEEKGKRIREIREVSRREDSKGGSESRIEEEGRRMR